MQDYFKSGLAKAGELAGAATVAAGAFAEVHPSIATRPIAAILLAGARPCWQTRERQSVCQVPSACFGVVGLNCLSRETYAAKTGRDPDADIAHASEKVSAFPPAIPSHRVRNAGWRGSSYCGGCGQGSWKCDQRQGCRD